MLVAWSLSVITSLLLTGETLFQDQARLIKYVSGAFAFPVDILIANKVSQAGCEFVRELMQPDPNNRPQVEECQQKPWLQSFTEEVEPQGYYFPNAIFMGARIYIECYGILLTFGFLKRSCPSYHFLDFIGFPRTNTIC